MTMESSEKLYELSMIEAISGGDTEFVNTMLHLFIETMPQTMNDLKQHTIAGEWEMMGKTAHKMKSTIDSMGIVSLKQDIRTLEMNGKQQLDLENIPAMVDHVITVLDQTILQLKKDFDL